MDSYSNLLARISALEAENKQLKSAYSALHANSSAYLESQTMFQTVFESSRLGNKIINRDLVIIQANSALVNLLGYSSSNDIIGTKIFDYAPEDRRQDWAILQDKLWNHSASSFSLETCLEKRDGTIIRCQVTSILFTNHGETFGYTIIEDVTEQHALRLQKDQFISVASHELKTPITSLKATLQLINKFLKNGGTITDSLLKLGQNADRNVTKLTNLVNDLLNTTKIGQAQLSLNKTMFCLAEVIDGCCSHINLDNKHHIVYLGDPQLEVFADEQKIDQVMVNLVNNAVKYAPAAEQIIVKAEKMEGCTKISVIDHGIGIPQASIPKLFERYFRVDPHSYTPGLGLGLYISSEIIRRHGGQIGAESASGNGSTFWFTLPDRNALEGS